MNHLSELRGKIFANLRNKALLDFFKIDASDELEAWGEAGIAFEGETTFFNVYARNLPLETKYQLGIHSLLANEKTGEIFAFHCGRFTFLFRCDFARNQLENSDKFRFGITLDDAIDIRPLGENWAILNKFDDEPEQLEWAYELTTGKIG